MPNELRFLAGARQEFDEAFDWYASRSDAAAIGFTAEIDAAIEKITADPQRFPQTYAGCQRCLLSRNPYSVVFHTDVDQTVIVAIAHAKRPPGYWTKRNQ